jgi:hypothetical protein
MKTKAWNLTLPPLDVAAGMVIAVLLMAMPVLLVQLLTAKPGTVWRVLGLDIAWGSGYVLVCIAGSYLIARVIAALPGRETWTSPLGRSLAFAFTIATAHTIIDTAAGHKTPILWFGAGFLGAFSVAASIELWRFWRNRRDSQLSTPVVTSKSGHPISFG